MLLYFVVGLLPDPEGPWTPELAHCCAWLVGALSEIVIVVLHSHARKSLRVRAETWDTLNALSVARISVLSLMITTQSFLYLKTNYLSVTSDLEENQSLLQNGNEPEYGTNNRGTETGSAKVPQRSQVSGTGWLDYIAGFRTLFPYLW